MKIWFVSRHPGAREWIKSQGINVDYFADHISLDELDAGDRVIGTLPIHLIAQLCAMGVEYWNLNLDLPLTARGKELTASELIQYGAHLQRFEARKISANWK